MNFPTTLLLGAIAGFTIFLGLPLARRRDFSPSWHALLNATATGILLFLLWDVITKASEPIEASIGSAKAGQPATFALLLVLFAAGFGVGLMSPSVAGGRIFLSPGRSEPNIETNAKRLALLIAIGIGLHNLSEGLAIGQASRSGELSLALVLIVGFGLHNATEGFGIVGPLGGVLRPGWGFLALTGLIAGGPTFVGTALGYAVRSEPAFVLFLAMAAGSIFYVIAELLNVGRKLGMRRLTMPGVLIGFLAGYGSDLVLTWAGA